jgi:predicted transcriptional regulator
MTHITIEKDKIEQVIQWAEKHGEIVFAGGGMDAVDSMNVFVESLRRSVAKAEKQEPIGYISERAAELLVKKKQAHGQIRIYQLFTHDVAVYTHRQPKREFVGLTIG